MTTQQRGKARTDELQTNSWRWLTLEEAADYCGVKGRTIRTWVETGRVTYYKPSRRLLFLRGDLDKVIEEARVQ